MKKTSKKLLSLFLAVVMIITSCSVGLTAFAADQPSDSYWSNKSDAEAAFDSLNDLVDEYVPMLLNIDAIKNILENNLGMTVNDETTISDVVEGASPLLLGLLGGSADKAAIRGDSSPLADTHYAYLDDETGVMNFYALYKFCQDNKDKGGEVGAYASETFPKLQELLNAYGKAEADFYQEYDEGLDYIGNITDALSNDDTVNDEFGGDITSIPLDFLNEFVYDGKALKSTEPGVAQTFATYTNGMIKGVKSNIEPVSNMAELIYYTQGMGMMTLFSEIYLGMALFSGLPLEYEDFTFTMQNYPQFIETIYPFDTYLSDDIGMDPADFEQLDEDTKNSIKAMYDNLVVPGTMFAFLSPDDDVAKGPFYREMCIGVLIYSGLYENAEQIDAEKVTNEQINTFVEYAQAHFNKGIVGGQTSVDINDLIAYVNSGECPFSETAKTFMRNTLNDSNFRPQLVNFLRLATDGKVDELKDWSLNFGIDAYEGKTFFEAVNFIIPSIILNEKINDNTTAFQLNDVASSFINLNTYFENIAPKTADKKFKYADYAVPANLTVDAVNSSLNALLDKFLAPGAMIAGIVDVNKILGSLVESDIQLYKGDGTGALDNLWLNLYKNPVETVFKLLPILDILLDELVLPLLLNGEGDERMLELYEILTGEEGLLLGLSQKAGPEKGVHVGIGALNFDLNKALPAILHWITGDEDYAYETVGKYNSKGADAAYYANLKAYCDANKDEEGNRLTYDGGFDSIPKFINIYAADKAIYKFKLSSLTEIFKKNGMDETLAQGLTEAITELASFAMEAIDQYVLEHGDDKRYGVDYTADPFVTQRGLNNLMVALPQVLDNMGKLFIEKYNIDSDWTYTYSGKIVEIEKEFRNGQKVTQLRNTTLQGFKDSYKNGADAVLGSFVNILIGNWINAILDLVNDTVADKNSIISQDLKIVNELLNALGGFGEKSIITDVVNGFFSLTRKDDASFTLQKNDATGFNGFSNESGFFLLTNLQYDDNGTQKGIIPFIISLVNGGNQAQALSLSDVLGESDKKASFAPLAANKSAAGTDYNKLLTKDNIKAANELVTKLDKILSSLLKNTSVNGFDLTSTDSILSAALSFVSNYIGQSETEDLLNLIDAYIECIVGENAEGPIKAKKVYTSKNLSNLVVETYTLIEAIAGNLLASVDATGNIANAICGIISPDSVGVRMNAGYEDTAEILLDGHKSWTELKDTNLKFNFSAGDKVGFYDALGESVNGIATVVGFILTGISSTDGKNFYSELVLPIFTQLAKATGATGVMTADEFNGATDAQKLIKGIVTPLSNILAQLYKHPATFIVNLVQGLAGIVEDSQFDAILKGVVAPINATVIGTIDGVADLVNYLSPTLSAYLSEAINGAIGDIFPLDLKVILNLSDKDILVSLINSVLPENVAAMIKLPSINWSKLSNAKTTGEAFLLIYGYVVDTVLGSQILTSLLESVDENIAAILKNLSAAQLLQVLNDVLDVATTPTEIYWTFSEYASKLTGTFTYPQNVSSKDAEKAVEELDGLVNNIFPLLETFGLNIGSDLTSIVNDNLFTNELLTTLATSLYGALDGAVSSNETVADLLGGVGLSFSPKAIAAILMDKSYGATYSSAANTLKNAKSWDKVTSLNWGFKNGSKMAQQGFVNGLAAILRPFLDIVAVLTADNALEVDFDQIKTAIVPLLNSLDVETALGETGTLVIKNGVLTITIVGDKASTIKVKLSTIAADALSAFENFNLYLGTNGYENAIVPLLEAFMIDDLKTYKEYLADIKKAKDNVILDILNPIVGLINDVLASPISTITGILPNLAYFIDNNGLAQAIGNLLAPIVSTKGVLGVLAKNGLNIDKLLVSILGTDLGSIITGLIGIDVKLNLEIMHLEKCNIQDIVIPLISSLVEGFGIKLPEFTFAQIASLGTLKAYQSAARNDKGNFAAKHVVADNGKVLIAVLRFVGEILVTNATAIKNLLLGIDAIASNETIANVISSIFDQLKTASKDDIVRAIFYFLTENATDAYWNYEDYKSKDYSFDYGDIDAGFMAELAEIVDGSVGQIFALLKELGVADITSLQSLVDDNLYKNDLVAKIATGLYGAIEGVELGDMGSLASLLAKTDIDFTTKNVANLLTDSKYGKAYPEAAKAIAKAGSWKKVKAADLDFKVTDRDSFLNALCAVLRPIYGVLDVLFNDGSLNLFDLVSVPGSNGYESTLVPILEALGVEGLKTMAELKSDAKKAYDNILLDVLVPVFNWLEGIIDAPFESIASMLPSIGLFIANDGLIQAINNLLTPVSALLKAVKPIVDINKLLAALGLDLDKTLGDLLKKAGIKVKLHVDVYNLPATLKPLIGQKNIVPLLNAVLGIIKVSGKPLNIEIPEIDWFQLASHGECKTVPSVAKNTENRYDRETVEANIGETLLAVLRWVENLLINNADSLSDLLGGIDAIKNNKTILNIINSVLGNISKATMDDIVKAVLYFFEGRSTDKFFDYTTFDFNDTNDFSWGELDQEFCETLPPMLDGLVSGLLEGKGGLLGLIGGLIYKDEIVSKLATALYGAIEGVKLGDIGSLTDILALVGIDFSTENVANLLTDEAYGTQFAANAAKIKAAGSWKNVKPESLSWGVTDRDSFVNALCAVLRPIYGVLDVLLNDGLLNLYDIVSVPGSDGYTSTIVPLLEAFSCYNIKTQYQYRADMATEYDAILKDVLNPLLDKVEDLLNAPVETLASMLPNLSLFFANDGLLQIIDNLLTPVSALLNALKPILNVNDLLDALGVDLGALIAKAGLNIDINLDVYDLKASLQPLIGAENVVGLLNNILGIIKIKGTPLGLVLPEIDWFKLAAHGDVITTGSSAVATNGTRVYVVADSATQEAETLIAVLRFVVNTVNYKDNYNTIVNLIGGLIGGADSSITDVVGTVLDMLKGDADKVILDLVELLKSFA